MHIHERTDERGDITDVITFCSDSCHRDWCAATGADYGGWNGCHESPDYGAYCTACGVIAGGARCECQRNNVVVNRFTSDAGEMCEHGNWLQLPAWMLDERVTA